MVRPVDIQNLYLRTTDLEKIQQNQQHQVVNQQTFLGHEMQAEIVRRQSRIRELKQADSQERLDEADTRTEQRHRRSRQQKGAAPAEPGDVSEKTTRPASGRFDEMA